MSEKTPVGKWSILWLSIVSVPTVLLTIYLLEVGEKGTAIATVLAVPIGIFAIAVPLIVARQRSSAVHQRMSLRHMLTLGTVALLLGVLVPATIFWVVSRYSDLDADFGEPFVLNDVGSQTVQARLPKDDWRGRLVFTPMLVSDDPVNDCVLTSTLKITPRINGLDGGRSYEARHGQPVQIPIPPRTHEVKLVIAYVPENKECVVTVSLSDGTLQR